MMPFLAPPHPSFTKTVTLLLYIAEVNIESYIFR